MLFFGGTIFCGVFVGVVFFLTCHFFVIPLKREKKKGKKSPLATSVLLGFVIFWWFGFFLTARDLLNFSQQVNVISNWYVSWMTLKS